MQKFHGRLKLSSSSGSKNVFTDLDSDTFRLKEWEKIKRDKLLDGYDRLLSRVKLCQHVLDLFAESFEVHCIETSEKLNLNTVMACRLFTIKTKNSGKLFQHWVA
jgi:hypothetical protein